MLLALVPLGMLLRSCGHCGDLRTGSYPGHQRATPDERNRVDPAAARRMASPRTGDLTVQPTVTEDITGAIADSVNYAVEALRKLVATINHSAMQVDASARQTQSGTQLGKASAVQTKQITSATESIAAMAASTEVSNPMPSGRRRRAPFGRRRTQGRRPCAAPSMA